MKPKSIQEHRAEVAKAEADQALEIHYGPGAPPLAQQLGIETAGQDQDSIDFLETAQMFLDGMTRSLAAGNATVESAMRMRQQTTEVVVRRFFPETEIVGQEHRDSSGRFLGS